METKREEQNKLKKQNSRQKGLKDHNHIEFHCFIMQKNKCNIDYLYKGRKYAEESRNKLQVPYNIPVLP